MDIVEVLSLAAFYNIYRDQEFRSKLILKRSSQKLKPEELLQSETRLMNIESGDFLLMMLSILKEIQYFSETETTNLLMSGSTDMNSLCSLLIFCSTVSGT